MRERIIYTMVVIFSFFSGVLGTYYVFINYPVKVEEVALEQVEIIEKDSITKSIEKIYDAVVLVDTYKNKTSIGTGTGFIYKKDNKHGYVITNYHVIENANVIKVINNNGEKVDATLLGSDAYADIAVLAISPENVLKVAEIGESSKSNLGDTLFTVGSPLGAEYMGTVTKGILSGKERTVSVNLAHGYFMLDVLQTDAAINPGNSGGPLVNINGEVIGVNSLKLVQDEIEGMGFAIPIEIVMAAVDRLEKGEEIKRPLLGVEIYDATETYALYRMDLYYNEAFENGVAIVDVQKQSPAEKAGLKRGDVILEVNGTKITGIAHFRFVLYKFEVGDTIKVKYYRDGEILETTVKLDKSVEDN